MKPRISRWHHCVANTLTKGLLFSMLLLALAVSAYAGDWEIVFQDTFNRPDDYTDINANLPTGQSGSMVPVDYQIERDKSWHKLGVSNNFAVFQQSNSMIGCMPDYSFDEHTTFAVEVKADVTGMRHDRHVGLAIGGDSSIGSPWDFDTRNVNTSYGIRIQGDGDVLIYTNGFSAGSGSVGSWPAGFNTIRVEVATADFNAGTEATVEISVNDTTATLPAGADTFRWLTTDSNYVTLEFYDNTVDSDFFADDFTVYRQRPPVGSVVIIK